jgi:Flp pilus assembly protein TadG
MEIMSRKRRRQKGQAAVETVLVIVPLFMVLLGILDFSVAIFVMDTMEYAARQGVRYAVLQQAGPTGHQDDAIRQTVRNNSLGFLSNTVDVPDAQLTINYYALNPGTNTWVLTAGGGSNAGGNLVKVGVSGFNWAWMIPSWRPGANGKLAITAAAADIMQGCPGGVCPNR